MMTKQATRLTRPQRRAFHAATMTLAWCVLAAIMLGRHTQRYQLDMTDAGPASVSVVAIGCPNFLTITTRTAADGTKTSIWDWSTGNVAVVVLALLFWAALCIACHRWLVNRSRVPLDQCDQCGYDLRGVASPRCPECGAGRI